MRRTTKEDGIQRMSHLILFAPLNHVLRTTHQYGSAAEMIDGIARTRLFRGRYDMTRVTTPPLHHAFVSSKALCDFAVSLFGDNFYMHFFHDTAYMLFHAFQMCAICFLRHAHESMSASDYWVNIIFHLGHDMSCTLRLVF
jgi:hypothetical protein